MTSPEKLFGDLFAAQPGRPFVSYYDESVGERAELSAKSLANWVTKTHFLLLEDFGVGDAAYVALPPHWISVPVLLGCWSAGLRIVSSPDDADVAFTTPDLAPDASIDRYAIAPGSTAAGFRGNPPAGLLDYVAAVRPQPDVWATVRLAASSADAALDDLSRADLVARGRDAAAAAGLGAGGRLLTTRDWTTPEDWIATLVAPLAVGGSVVYVRNCADRTVLERRATQERADVILT